MVSTALYFTFFRIIASPLFPFFYFYSPSLGISEKVMPFFLLILVTLLEFTDLFDGFIARKKGEVTDLGKILDPISDSITHITIFFTFTKGVVGIPMLWVLIFLYRDFLVSALRTVCALKGYALSARKSGKLKAILQGGACYGIILSMIFFFWGGLSQKMLHTISSTLVAVVAIYTAFSTIDYFFANRKYLKKMLQAD